ncbi:MAG: hydrogenase nickel incorporation protein HypB [Desulfovibrio sp.]|jgi:hydrogenase nickel incorporation protein HypB|nr:hydrogenase nickel incorporation protein HypB [Desulfovibrio sp.]
METPVVRNLLENNDAEAAQLRALFAQRGVAVLNIIGSPGAGKTALLERTFRDLGGTFSMAVIEGDPQTDNDARRIVAAGGKAVQINTGGGCHLDAALVRNALNDLDLEALDLLFIENVGNLVCPVEFDCGEDCKVALLSVPEGDDKPEKYPLLFNLAAVMVLNKIDLLPHTDFNIERATRSAGRLNGKLATLPLSCRTGEGLDGWYDFLRRLRTDKAAGMRAAAGS